MNNAEIEAIVRSVLANMQGAESSAAPASNGKVPAKSKAAVLTELGHFDIKEFDIPQLGDEDILVKVEGCGVCGTDAHEFKRDPFGLIPVVLGHENFGRVVRIGKKVKKFKVGDRVICANAIVRGFDKKRLYSAKAYEEIRDFSSSFLLIFTSRT